MTVIRIRYVKRGKHYHCRLFTADCAGGVGIALSPVAGSPTFALCGTLVFNETECHDLMAAWPGCEWIDDEAQEAA